MGYRDDVTALQGRRDVLQRELTALEQHLAGLHDGGEKLRQELRRERFHLALARVWRWMRQHPKTMTFLLAVVGLFLFVGVKSCQERHERRRRMEQTLGRDCATRLKVDASFRGAGVLVNGVDIGNVPVDVAICRGYYRVQVIHDKALPWQRVVNVGVQPVIEINAALIPFEPSRRPRDSIVVFSDPPGAILFANGEEVGRTPVLLRPGDLQGENLHLALWSSAVTPIQLWRGKKEPRALWFHLGRRAVERQR